jgi:hypothetical protein
MGSRCGTNTQGLLHKRAFLRYRQGARGHALSGRLRLGVNFVK